MAAPMSWKACRWVLVRSVSIGAVAGPVKRTWFAGQGGQVLQQAAEAAVGASGLIMLV